MRRWQGIGWGSLALLIGITASQLPPIGSLLLLAGVSLGVVSLLDARVALIATLLTAPLKAILATEIPLLANFLDIGQILLLWTLLCWWIVAVVHKTPLFHRSSMYIPLLIWIGLALPSFWQTIAPLEGLQEITKWIEMLLLIAVVLSFTQDNSTWLVITLVVVGSIQAAWGVSQFFSSTGPASFAILGGTHFRAYGSFGNPDPFGGFMSLCLCFTLGVFVHQLETVVAEIRQRQLRFLTILSCFLVGGAVLLLGMGLLGSWSRGAWIGFGITFIGMLFLFLRHFWLRILVLGGLGIGLSLTILLQIIPVAILARLTDFTQQFTSFDVRGAFVTDSNYALIERLAHWQAALGMATDSPWFGVGLGGYPASYPHYALLKWSLPLGHAHNYYLNVLAETGLVGLTGYLLALVGVGWLIFKARRVNRTRPLVIGIWGAWLGLAIHNGFDMLYVNNMFIHQGVLLGLAARYGIATPHTSHHLESAERKT